MVSAIKSRHKEGGVQSGFGFIEGPAATAERREEQCLRLSQIRTVSVVIE